MKRCNTCGGVYNNLLPDGMQYFHACPPLSIREVREAMFKSDPIFTREQAATIEQLRAADQRDPVPAGDPTRVDRYLERIVVERPLRRDENVRGSAAPGEQTPIAREGQGVTEIEP